MAASLYYNTGTSWEPFCVENAPALRYNDAGWVGTCMSGTGDKHVYGNVDGVWVPVCCDLNEGGGGEVTYRDTFPLLFGNPTSVFEAPDGAGGLTS